MGCKQKPGPLGPFRGFQQKVVPSGGSNPARPGELGGNHLPLSSYKQGKEGKAKMFSLSGIQDSLEISEENCFRGKNPSRGASVMLPRRFRERFREDSSPFFIVLRSCFVVLWSSTGKFSKSNLSIHSMHPQWSPIVSRTFIFILFVFRTPF